MRFRHAALAVAVCVCLPASAANNNKPDSYCKRTLHTSDTTAWTVDQSMPIVLEEVTDRVNPLAYSDAVAWADQLLQNVARHSRARVRARIVGGSPDCTWGTGSCITYRTDAEEPSCSTAQGVADCFLLGECAAALCYRTNPANRVIADWDADEGGLDQIEAHELGHTYGLSHASGADTEGQENCAALNIPKPGCDGFSDECEGETMCPNTGCFMSQHYAFGDMRGFRSSYGNISYQTRKAYYGSRALPGVGTPTIRASAPLSTGVFPPRIDCTKNTAATGPYQCVATYASVSGSTQRVYVFGLAGWSPTSGWTTQDLVGYFNQPFIMPPDIAINGSGSRAWITYVNEYHETYVRRIELATGTWGPVISAGIHAVLPPRLMFNSDLGDGAVLLLAKEARALWSYGYDPPDDFTSPTTVVAYILGDVLDYIGGANLGGTTDFDLDCRRVTGAADECVQVEIRRVDSSDPVDRYWSRHFRVGGSPLAVQYQGNYVVGAHSANAVIGVTLSNDRLFVSAGRAVLSGTQTTNSRLAEYSSLDVAGSGASTATVRSDATTCATGTSWGNTLPGMTMHGGYPIAWCPTCGGTGTIESTHFGARSDNDTFCF